MLAGRLGERHRPGQDLRPDGGPQPGSAPRDLIESNGSVVFTADDCAYGASPTDTGSLYSRSLADGSGSTLIALRGGAGSIATTTAVAPGTTDVYALSKDKAEHVTVTTTSGESLGSPNTGKVTRMLWLRTL